MTRRTAAQVFWTALSIVVIASVLTELGRSISGANVLTPQAADLAVGTRVLRFFSYFTIESNLFVLVSTIPLALDPTRDGRAWRVLRLDALLGITVTGMVYAVVLGPSLNPVGLGWWTNAGLHYVAPVVTVVGWLVLGPRPRVDAGTVRAALVWPLAWTGYVLVLGAISGWYPYPFLDAAMRGYPVALRNVALVALVAVLVVTAYAFLDGRLHRALRGSADGAAAAVTPGTPRAT